ncbi:MAG: cytochrome C biogenesis protein CcsB [Bergeyella sp.]|nr:cytochrome C biogenesis protein CcsB [Bergeyella sp.]
MNKIIKIVISTRTTVVLLFVFAMAMAYATFVENDYGTSTAKALIYEAKWFEGIMVLLILNFIGNIKRYRLWKREKWPLLVFHLSFVFIFLGGAITRYISFEGVMHIREGEMSNEIVTDKTFFKIQIEEKGEKLNYRDIPYVLASQKPLIAKITPHIFSASYNFNGEKIKVKQVNYVQRKKDSLVADSNGAEYIHFVIAGETGRENFYIKSGEIKNIGGMLITFNRSIEGAIEFKKTGDELCIKFPLDAQYLTMATRESGQVKKDKFFMLRLRSLYTMGGLRLVVPEPLIRGSLLHYEGDKNKEKNLPDVLTVEVKTENSKQRVDLLVEKNNPNSFKQIFMDGKNIMLGMGPKVYNTPFYLKLEKFVMETNPGSNSPSAYESHVKVIDNGSQTPYKIYMNHVLDYKGYRFFQASYDQDRGGTVLSVNHDWWGTLVSYVGYMLLFLGMFILFFWRGTHFWKLNTRLSEMNKNKNKIVSLLIILMSLGSFTRAQEIDMHGKDGSEKIGSLRTESGAGSKQNSLARPLGVVRKISSEEIIRKSRISGEHAEKFGYLLVQNYEGRTVPMSTQALDVLRKLYKKDRFVADDGSSLDANAWFLSMSIDTESWTMVPLIKVNSKGGDELRRKVKADGEGYTSLMNLFPIDRNKSLYYVLEKDYSEALAKKASEQTHYDKAVIDLNDKVQVFNAFFSGQYLRMIPVKNDPNHRWNSWLDENFSPDPEAQKVMAPYFLSIIDARNTGDWSNADKELEHLMEYQKKWGKHVIPSQTKIDLEVFMNKLNLNFKLLIFYSVLGSVLLVLGFFELFSSGKLLRLVIRGLIIFGVLGYFLQFLGLVARWYISGHAPWSNGYEAIIFISWIGITAGLLLYRHSNALVPSAGFLVAMIMMGFAHGGSALDPQITPLVPVLKSYWLMIHVAIITASYGFFGLSMVIGIIVLLFYCLADKILFRFHNSTTIRELTIVSEMSLTIGLFALTVGTFLGGIWANESWGRYWSWDPKETWAFISVMVYAIVLHMRLVPGLRGRWSFHFAGMLSIWSIIMTYFGVNYYLSGLHSYAAGDAIPVPLWVYLGLAGMGVLGVVSYLKYRSFSR